MAETLTSRTITATYSVTDGALRAESIQNRLTGRTVPLVSSSEVAVVLSSVVDRVAEPRRVDDFRVVETVRRQDAGVVWLLRSADSGLEVEVHVDLQDSTRIKWVELINPGQREVLVLDVVVDDFRLDTALEGGGQGQPAFIASELFAAIE
ncbi:MAG TPA: hypothetical protein VFH83_06475, partial [Spirochaetia bacterium]|nr:hypothetical protein [Spirochaetia bacterium]